MTQRRYVVPTWMLNVWITLVATFLIAVASLNAEDWLERFDDQKFAPSRIWWMATALVLLGGLSGWRARRARSRGTLYYVRLLPAWMSDRHLDAVRQEHDDHLDERVVSRHLTSPRLGVVDAVEELESALASLESAMNDDDADTGFTIAPNMIHPCGLAVGYRMHAWAGLRLCELTSPKQPLEWTLGQGADLGPRLTCRTLAAEQRPKDNVEAVLLSVAVTGAPDVPVGWQPQVHRCVALWPPGDAPDDSRPATCTVTHRAESTARDAVHPQHAVDFVAAAIVDLMVEFPNSTVYLTVRVPKAVAVAIGHRLSGPGRLNRPGDLKDGPLVLTREPWRRLVPLAIDQSEAVGSGAYHAFRVDKDQPDVVAIRERARRHGLPLSGDTPSSLTTAPPIGTARA